MQRNWRFAPIALAIVSAAFVAVGCGGDRQSAEAEQTSHLRTLLSFYNNTVMKTGRPPASEETFRESIAQKSDILAKLGVESVDDLFISERDGQPFVVIYGQPPEGLAEGIVAYEQTGVDGKRQVGYDIGRIEEVDEARFNELTSSGTE